LGTSAPRRNARHQKKGEIKGERRFEKKTEEKGGVNLKADT